MANSIIQALLSLISPAEAEAKIVGSPQAMKLLREIIADTEGSEEYLPQIYNKIIKEAEKRPEEVEVLHLPGLNKIYGNAADFWPNNRIEYDPAFSKEDSANILSHELIHFLNNISKQKLDTQQQHSIIEKLLGTQVYKPAAELRGYIPPNMSTEDTAAIKSWLGEQ